MGGLQTGLLLQIPTEETNGMTNYLIIMKEKTRHAPQTRGYWGPRFKDIDSN